MDWPKVKTILIVFLLMINLLIGALFVTRNLEEKRLDHEMVVNAIAALERLGVKAEATLIQTKQASIYMLEIERDVELEKAAYAAVIGDIRVEDKGGGNIELTGTGGTARLESDGKFLLSLSGHDRFPVAADREASALEVFLAMKISAAEDLFTVYETGNGYTVKGTQTVKGKQVFNRTYEMRFDDRGLYSMQGGRILGEPLVCDERPSVSVTTALFAFVDQMNKNGTPCREILSAELGYYTESAAPGYTRLVPVWAIGYDLGTKYIDAITLDFMHELPK